MKIDLLDDADGVPSCRGVLFREGAGTAKHLGVVLFPDARRIGETAKPCAVRLAGCGFTVLVADLYGNGGFAAEMSEAHALMRSLLYNVDAWRRRARAALDALPAVPSADGRLAAIGYCFGGTTALELARSGAPLTAVMSFHGGLVTTQPEDAANIRAKILVCHGAVDPVVPPNRSPTSSRRWQRRGWTGTSTPTPVSSMPSPIPTPAAPARRRSLMTRTPTVTPGRR